MKKTEVRAKSILSASKVSDYTLNPYIGCQHACSYCYARFIKRFTRHSEPWGEFVDIKINAPDLLKKDILQKKKGCVWMSGICDPYQPLEKRYQLTRRCLEMLIRHEWPVIIQTRSSLVLRDMDILRHSRMTEVGLSITTADDRIREIFEPRAPPISERLQTIKSLHQNGIRTYVMIAPMLPGVETLVPLLAGYIDYLIIDRMNYRHAERIYRMYGWEEQNTDAWFAHMKTRIANDCCRLGIECRPIY